MDLYSLVERLCADPIATVKSGLVMLHLFGLVLGLGTATLLDLFIVRYMVFHPITHENCNVVEFASKVLGFGLLILWISGVGFLIHYVMFDPAKLINGKVWAKVIIVGALTVNGATIHGIVLPLIRQRIGRKVFEDMSPGLRSGLMGVGAISAISWYVPMMLGAFPQFNFVSAWTVLAAYGLLLVGALVVTQAAGRLIR